MSLLDPRTWFRRTAAPTAASDILDYDDELEAQRRDNARLEQRVLTLRDKIADLEAVEERVSRSIVEKQRECDAAVRQAEDDAADAIRKARAESRQELAKLEEQIAQLKSEQHVKTQEIEHMIRMNDERNELELERSKLRYESEKNSEIQKVRDEFAELLEDLQTKQIEAGEKRFSQIMDRLPDTKVRLSGEVG